MNPNRRPNFRVPPPKELLSIGGRALGLYVGTALILANDIIPWVIKFSPKLDSYRNQIISKYPYPADPITMFSSGWIAEVLFKIQEFLHIPVNGEATSNVAMILGAVLGPALIGITLFPELPKKFVKVAKNAISQSVKDTKRIWRREFNKTKIN